jgi:putative transposase
MISYKYKIYNHCNKNRHLDNLRVAGASLWNYIVKFDQKYYKIYKKSATKSQLQHLLTKHYVKNNEFWAKMGSQSKQEIVERYCLAKEKFFKKKGGFPKPKKWKNFRSFCYKQNIGYSLNGNHLTIHKIDRTFTFYKSREIEGNIKQIRIKKSSANEWYLYVITDKSTTTHLGRGVTPTQAGFDFGLKTYLTGSDGSIYESPQFFKKNFKLLQKASRNVSRKIKKSNNFYKAVHKLQKVHERTVNQRDDYQWKLAHELCQKHDKIFLEDLTFKGMQRLWGRKVSDLSHSSFVNKLEQVALKYGTVVHKIDRYYPSSKTCSNCGYVNRQLTLRDREWTCPDCGLHHDRDYNAAVNILRQGVVSLNSDSKTMLQNMASCV